MTSRLFLMGALALAAAATRALPLPAHAAEEIHAPEAIRACLCREQLMADLSRTLADAERAHDAAEQRLKSLSAEAETARQKLDPADAAARGRLGQLLDARDQAQDRLALTVPPLNDAVARYNKVVGAFNDYCAGKGYDPAVLPQVKASLACPPEAGTAPRS